MANVAVPDEASLALLTPRQQRNLMSELADQVRTLRGKLANAKSAGDSLGGPVNKTVAEVGLNAVGAFTAGAAYEALQAKIDAGEISERYLHLGGGIDTTVLGSLALAGIGVAVAHYGEKKEQEREAANPGEEIEESPFSARNLGAAATDLGLGGVMLWMGRLGGKAVGLLRDDEPQTAQPATTGGP